MLPRALYPKRTEVHPWEVPLGTTPELSEVPEARQWGSPIFDVETGKVLWEAELPASDQATPMTYRSRSGKQFMVIAGGGHALFGTERGDHVVAFALH